MFSLRTSNWEKITPIYENKNFLAINKPAGLLVHQTIVKRKEQGVQREETLVDWLLKNCPEIKGVGDLSAGRRTIQTRPGIVHRLDKDTSGVILVAKHQKYFEYLKNLFQNHQIKKNYLALVWGKLEPRTGSIKKSICLKSGSVKRTVWRGKIEKEAITNYQVLKYFKYSTSLTIGHKVLCFSLARVMPKTGRTHQIRVHLASIGHPIVGDQLYGPKSNPLNLERQFLHAESLEFSSAEGQRIKIEAGLPRDLKTILKRLTNK